MHSAALALSISFPYFRWFRALATASVVALTLVAASTPSCSVRRFGRRLLPLAGWIWRMLPLTGNAMMWMGLAIYGIGRAFCGIVQGEPAPRLQIQHIPAIAHQPTPLLEFRRGGGGRLLNILGLGCFLLALSSCSNAHLLPRVVEYSVMGESKDITPAYRTPCAAHVSRGSMLLVDYDIEHTTLFAHRGSGEEIHTTDDPRAELDQALHYFFDPTVPVSSDARPQIGAMFHIIAKEVQVGEDNKELAPDINATEMPYIKGLAPSSPIIIGSFFFHETIKGVPQSGDPGYVLKRPQGDVMHFSVEKDQMGEDKEEFEPDNDAMLMPYMKGITGAGFSPNIANWFLFNPGTAIPGKMATYSRVPGCVMVGYTPCTTGRECQDYELWATTPPSCKRYPKFASCPPEYSARDRCIANPQTGEVGDTVVDTSDSISTTKAGTSYTAKQRVDIKPQHTTEASKFTYMSDYYLANLNTGGAEQVMKELQVTVRQPGADTPSVIVGAETSDVSTQVAA